MMSFQYLYSGGLWLSFLLLVFTVASYIYLAYIKIHELISYLPNCKALQHGFCFLNAGVFGRSTVFGSISHIVIFSKWYIRNGLADQRDIDTFPKRLKRHLQIHFTCTFICLLSAVAVSCVKSYLKYGSVITINLQNLLGKSLLSGFVLTLLLVASYMYLAYIKIDKIISCLPNCKALQDKLTLFKVGGRLAVLSAIGDIVLRSKKTIRSGGADQRDVDAFPKHLKFHLRVHVYCVYLWLTNCAVLIYAMKSAGHDW